LQEGQKARTESVNSTVSLKTLQFTARKHCIAKCPKVVVNRFYRHAHFL